MFPLTESAFWLISFCVVFLPMALPLAGYRRVAAFVGAGVLFWLLLWRTGATSGELYGLYYVFTLVALLVLAGVASLWSIAIRRLAHTSLAIAVVAFFAPSVLLSGWAVLHQTVPESCVEAGVTVRIQNVTLTLPFEDGRWFHLGTNATLRDYGHREYKAQTRQLCRMLEESGSVDITSLRVGDRYSATEFSIELTSAAKPDWDWNDFERATSYEVGTAQSGAECYLRDVRLEGAMQQRAYCAAWQPITPDFRAIAVNAPEPSRSLPESASALQSDLQIWLRTVREPVF